MCNINPVNISIILYEQAYRNLICIGRHFDCAKNSLRNNKKKKKTPGHTRKDTQRQKQQTTVEAPPRNGQQKTHWRTQIDPKRPQLSPPAPSRHTQDIRPVRAMGLLSTSATPPKTQRRTNDEDPTATNNRHDEAKKNKKKKNPDPGGPDQPEHQVLTDPPKRPRIEPPQRTRLIRRRATKEGSKVINRDWANHHACSPSHHIHVACFPNTSKNDLTKLSTKTLQAYISPNPYTKSPSQLNKSITCKQQDSTSQELQQSTRLGFIYGVCFVIVCSISLLLLVPREGCAP